MMRVMRGNSGKECSPLQENVGGLTLPWIALEKVELRRWAGKYRSMLLLAAPERPKEAIWGCISSVTRDTGSREETIHKTEQDMPQVY